MREKERREGWVDGRLIDGWKEGRKENTYQEIKRR